MFQCDKLNFANGLHISVLQQLNSHSFNSTKNKTIASARYSSLHSIKSLALKPSLPHGMRHSDLNFCPRLGGILGAVLSEFGNESIVVAAWGPLVQLCSEPNNISWPFEMYPDARAQLLAVCLCFNSKENTIKISLYVNIIFVNDPVMQDKFYISHIDKTYHLHIFHFDGLVQERCNSIANQMRVMSFLYQPIDLFTKFDYFIVGGKFQVAWSWTKCHALMLSGGEVPVS